MRWCFDITHILGKIHIGPDTLSRREITVALVDIMSCSEDTEEYAERELERMVFTNIPYPISWKKLRDYVGKDEIMKLLSDQISNGFPPERKLLRIELREFWQHREGLSQVDGVPLFKRHVVIPKSLRPELLDTLRRQAFGGCV